MLKIEKEKQESFFGDYIYEQVIPENHFLVKLAQVIDFSFVNDLVKDLYHESNGRPAWEPQVLFKMLFLEFLYKLSDVEIARETMVNLAFKWFVGLKVTDTPPDDSTLVRFRERLGNERLRKIFEKILKEADTKGLILKQRMVIVDSTDIKANVDINRIKEEHKDEKGKDSKYIDHNSPDPEASFGHKTVEKTFYGYKSHHLMDWRSELITEVQVTTGSAGDGPQLFRLLDNDVTLKDKKIKMGQIKVVGDSAYDSDEHRVKLKDRKMTPLILMKPVRKKKKIMGTKFKKIIQRVRSAVERKQAEMKERHQLRKARYLGLAKVFFQSLITAIVINCKKIVQLLIKPPNWLKRRVVSLNTG